MHTAGMEYRSWSKFSTAIILICLAVAILLLLGYLMGVGAGSTIEPITVNASMEFENARYYQSNNTVYFVASRSSDGPTYKATSFKRYSRWQCEDVALGSVRDLLNDRYGYKHSYLSTGISGSVVRVDALLDPFSNPNYYSLERNLPTHVEVTLHYKKGTRNCSIPINVNGIISPPQQSVS